GPNFPPTSMTRNGNISSPTFRPDEAIFSLKEGSICCADHSSRRPNSSSIFSKNLVLSALHFGLIASASYCNGLTKKKDACVQKSSRKAGRSLTRHSTTSLYFPAIHSTPQAVSMSLPFGAKLLLSKAFIHSPLNHLPFSQSNLAPALLPQSTANLDIISFSVN